MMTYEQAIKTIKIAKAEVEWNYPMEYQEAFDIAIDCIAMQTPKKPMYTGEKNVYGAVVRVCNECGDKVCISPMAKEYENYCRSCGKRLTDWNEVE